MKNLISLLPSTIIVLALTAPQILAQSTYEPYTFTTLAGKAGYGSEDGTGGEARFTNPFGVAVDNTGNVYVADTQSHTIRKVTPAGVVTTLAGLIGSSGSADGTGSDARFSDPFGVAVDSAGNVYVADTINCTIRKVTPVGVVTTLAGRTLFDQSGNYPRPGGSRDGTGALARFNNPRGVAVDSAGNVYVTDPSHHTIRKVTAEGVVTTLAGLAGQRGSVDGMGSDARFSEPLGVAVDISGSIYVGEAGTRIRKVTPEGVVTTLAENLPNWGVAVDIEGNLYVADQQGHTIRKVTSAGVVTTLAGLAGSDGSADGTRSDARFNYPAGVAVDGAGNVYVADTSNNAIRKVTPVGVATTLAGGRYRSVDGTSSAARFNGPSGVALDSEGNVYVTDTYSNTIRKVTPEGVVTTLAGNLSIRDEFGNPVRGSTDGTGSDARFNNPIGVTVDGLGNVYVADAANNTIRKITSVGVVNTLAGLAGSPGSTDGTGSVARFTYPSGVAVDSTGNVYVADSGNGTIRKIAADGVVSTLAGLAGSFGSDDGTGSAARFGGCNGFGCGGPNAIAVDSAGFIYVADWQTTIRKITPGGVVSTLAAARFRDPRGVTVDRAGNLYVADTSNNTIRKVTPEGVVTTLANFPGNEGSTDGTGNAAWFYGPSGVAVDSAGNLYVADPYNNTIRKGFAEPVTAVTLFGTSGADVFINAGRFSFDLIGPARKLVVVEASNDLVKWLPLWTNTFAGALHFIDMENGVSSRRFYRASTPSQ